MASKFLYIVDHFCPFPTSEYGGIWNVIATDDEECFDLITNVDEDFNQQHYGTLRKHIRDARVYLLGENKESCVVESFTT